MGIILTLIRKNPLEAASIAGLVILLALSGVLYIMLASAEADAREARAEARLLQASVQEWQREYAGLREATDQQREAVTALVRESAARSERAMAVIDAATKLSADLSRRATEILAARPPDGADPCIAAAHAFTAELRAERGEELP